METTKENRNWRAGKKGSRKKSVRPQVFGFVLVLVGLSALLVWLFWPRSVTGVQFFVITAEGEKSAIIDESFVRYETASVDNESVFSIFSALDEQFDNVTADRLTLSEFKRMPAQELDRHGSIGIVFINSLSRAEIGDDETARLYLQFGSNRQKVSFKDLIRKFSETSLSELILLLEISHELPTLSSNLLASGEVSLLEAEVKHCSDAYPDLKLTVISSAAPFHSSYPYLASMQDLKDDQGLDSEREIIHGTAFGHVVAEVFRSGDGLSMADLQKRIESNLETYVANIFDGIQTPQVYYMPDSTELVPTEPLVIFPEPYQAVSVESKLENKSETSEEEVPPKKTGNAEAEEQKPPAQKIADYRAQLSSSLTQVHLSNLKIGKWQRLNKIAKDSEYCLAHGNLKGLQFTLNEGQSLLRQIRSAAESMVQTDANDDLHRWVSSTDRTSDASKSFFNDTLLEVNTGDESRNIQLIEKFRSLESRQELLSSFLALCNAESTLADIDNDSPNLKKSQIGLHAELKTFFERLGQKCDWREHEWPQQFLFADDLLENSDFTWQKAHFEAFMRLQLLRSESLQLAAGWSLNGTDRLDFVTFSSLTPQITELLKKVTAAERWFFVGPNASRIMEQHLGDADELLSEIKSDLEKEDQRVRALTKHRLKILEVVPRIALRHESNILTSEFSALSPLSVDEMKNISARDFPSASFSEKMSREDAIALLQFTTLLNSKSSPQLASDTKTAIDHISHVTTVPANFSADSEFERKPVHQGIWLGFWSIRCIQALDEEANLDELFEAWIGLVSATATSEDATVIASQRVKLSDLLRAQWDVTSQKPIMKFQPVDQRDKGVLSLLREDLLLHKQLESDRYSSRFRKLFDLSSSQAVVNLRVTDDELKLKDDGTCKLNLDIPNGTQIFFYQDGVRLENSNFQDDGPRWQKGTWSQNAQTLKKTAEFSGEAQPIIAIVDKDQIVQDHRILNIGVAFQVTGWTVKFLSGKEELQLINYSNIEKTLKLPPKTGEASLPVTVRLSRPKNSYAKSILMNIAPLDEDGEPGEPIWPAFHELTLDSQTGSTVIPLFPPSPKEETASAPATPEKFVLTQGFAILIRSKDESDREDDGELKVSLDFWNPADDYLQVDDPEFNLKTHQLSVSLLRRQKDDMPEGAFAPEKIGAKLSYSPHLAQFSDTPPRLKELDPTSKQFLDAKFRSSVNDAIREMKEESGKEQLEFGLSVGGLDNVIKWRLGESLEIERVGYSRRGVTTEIRIGMELANKEEDGVISHNLDGIFVLGENWKNAILNLPLELYGAQEDYEKVSRLKLSLLGEGQGNQLPTLHVRGAYDRTVTATQEPSGQWLISTDSVPHGKFNVNFFEDNGITEGHHRLEATLIDESGEEIAAYQRGFVIEDSAPEIVWDSENPKKVLVGKNYAGHLIIEDPQTGLESVSLGLKEDSLVPIRVRTPGTKRQVKIPFTIDQKKFPKIEAEESDVEKEVTVFVQATNGIKMSEVIPYKILLRQPGVKKMTKPIGTPIVGDLIIKLPGTGLYDLVLTGAGGKVEVKLSGKKKEALFSDLPEGRYQLNWIKKYDGSKGEKSFPLKFKKNGEVIKFPL